MNSFTNKFYFDMKVCIILVDQKDIRYLKSDIRYQISDIFYRMDKKFSSDNLSSKLFWFDESGKEMDTQLMFQNIRTGERYTLGQEEVTGTSFNWTGEDYTKLFQ